MSQVVRPSANGLVPNTPCALPPIDPLTTRQSASAPLDHIQDCHAFSLTLDRGGIVRVATREPSDMSLYISLWDGAQRVDSDGIGHSGVGETFALFPDVEP